MTKSTIATLAVFATLARAAAAQPPRPADSPRTVTLALGEYNRLIDLASRPPQGPSVPPVAAVLASAGLRVVRAARTCGRDRARDDRRAGRSSGFAFVGRTHHQTVDERWKNDRRGHARPRLFD